MTLEEVLIKKGYSKTEARDLISEMRQQILAGADPEELLYDEGLEPDYIMDLIEF